jgi:hypothetical protein
VRDVAGGQVEVGDRLCNVDLDDGTGRVGR